jgi:hypothetical protein
MGEVPLHQDREVKFTFRDLKRKVACTLPLHHKNMRVEPLSHLQASLVRHILSGGAYMAAMLAATKVSL